MKAKKNCCWQLTINISIVDIINVYDVYRGKVKRTNYLVGGEKGKCTHLWLLKKLLGEL